MDRPKKPFRHYRGLSSSDKEYLIEFDRVFWGRANKEGFDKIGVTIEGRKELYRDRYRRRQDAGYRSKSVYLTLNETTVGGSDPSDALIEAFDKNRAKTRAKTSPQSIERCPLSLLPWVAKPKKGPR